MITRVTEAGQLNALANDPSIRPWIADMGDGIINLSKTAADPNNICLLGEWGGFVCFKYFPGSYEFHTMILPEGRGEWAYAFAQAGARYMFCATDAIELLTRIPRGHFAAAALTQKMMFRHQFTTPAECRFRGKLVECSIFGLTLQDWASFAPGFHDRGSEVHAWLNARCKGEPHPPDRDHNQVVGIAMTMAEMGQPQKAVTWFNRWAYAARHDPIELVSTDPLCIRFDAGELRMKDGQLAIQPCRIMQSSP